MRTLTLLSFLLLASIGEIYAQWQPVNGPDGTNARKVVQSGNSLLAVTTGGLYRSADGGAQWQSVLTGPLARTSVSNLEADGLNLMIRVLNQESGNYDLLISGDGGYHWRPITLSSRINNTFRGMAFNGREIIYRDSRQAYLSYDAGENWTTLSSSRLPIIPNSFYAQGGSFYVTSSNGQLFRSADPENEGWEELPFPIASTLPARLLVHGDTLLAGELNRAVYYSHDDGQNWTEATGIENFDVYNEGFWQANGNFYALDDDNLFRSEDGGMTWTATTGNRDIFNDVTPAAGGLFLLKSGEIYFSTDEGISLTAKNAGINGSTIYHWEAQGNGLTYYHNGRKLYHGSYGERTVSLDSSLAFAGTQMNEMLAAPDDYVYYIINGVGSQTNDVYRVSPTGEQTHILTATNQPWLASDHLEYADGKLFYFGNGLEQFSTDRGDTWQSQRDLYPRAFSDFARYEDAVFTIASSGVKRKKDGAAEWEDVNNGLQLEEFPIGTNGRDCRLISTEGALFALLSRSSSDFYDIYVSNDGGDNWQLTAQDLPPIIYPYSNAPPGVKEIVAVGGYHLLAARDVGVAISNDQGRNWTLFNGNLPTDRVEELHLVNGKVVVSTFRNGLWELDPASIQLRQVTGTVFLDENADGSPDAGEPGLPNVKLVLENGEDLSFTGPTGNYQLLFRNDGDFGPEINNPYFTAAPASRNTTTADTLHFGLQLTTEVNDLRVGLETDNVHRPGFSNRYYLRYENRAAATEQVILTLAHDPLLHYDGANRAPDLVESNTITYNLGELAPLETGLIVLHFTVPADAQLGTVLSSVATISSTAVTEFEPGDNVATLMDGLVGAFDPNDIAVDETILSPAMVRNEQVLHYRIRFQNTGTYPAETVVVRNDIDPGLVISSIKNVVTSHPYEIVVEGDRTLAFVFNDIQLADSTRDEAASHGFITYEMVVSEALVPGDSLFNQAAIYFDFNEPVITNTVATVIEVPDATRAPWRQLSALAFPNPVLRGAELSLVIDGPAGTLVVFDQLGRQVRALRSFHPATDRLQTEQLAPGVYFLQFVSPAGRVGVKLLVE